MRVYVVTREQVSGALAPEVFTSLKKARDFCRTYYPFGDRFKADGRHRWIGFHTTPRGTVVFGGLIESVVVDEKAD